MSEHDVCGFLQMPELRPQQLGNISAGGRKRETRETQTTELLPRSGLLSVRAETASSAALSCYKVNRVKRNRFPPRSPLPITVTANFFLCDVTRAGPGTDLVIP